MPLFLEGAGPRARWSSGSAELLLEYEVREQVLPFAVRCQFGSLAEGDVAMLDTASQHTILSSDTADRARGDLLEPLERMKNSSRLGDHRGHLYRIPIRLIADEGSDLVLQATCLVLDGWTGPNVLGYRGFADRLRIALDPGFAASNQPAWYFGAPLG